MNAEIKGLLSFIDSAPSAFHAAESVCSALRQEGTIPLRSAKFGVLNRADVTFLRETGPP